jgi:hypothetical protein
MMADQSAGDVADPTAEILATSGLLTMMGAVMAAVIAAAALGEGSDVMAGVLGAVALISFTASVVCFAADSSRAERAPLPFPSWLRAESETAAEPSGPR